MTKILFVVASAVLVTACGDSARRSPLAPTPVAATAPEFQQPFTELIIGSAIERKVDASSNPECIGEPGFRCQYFRITPDRDGTLEVELIWVVATQPAGLDLTHESATGRVWADFYGPGKGSITRRVKAGDTSQITVWYTFPGTEFSLRTALQPS